MVATSWDPGLDGDPDRGVNALAVAGTSVYAGGGFFHARDIPQFGFASFSPAASIFRPQLAPGLTHFRR